jgi:hypothetical protein
MRAISLAATDGLAGQLLMKICAVSLLAPVDRPSHVMFVSRARHAMRSNGAKPGR